jgi:CheY-like chemotaxis protein
MSRHRSVISVERGEGKAMARYSILIVDDEANQRLMLEQALRALAYDWVIATAASGEEALDALALCAPDLIITDYNMPTMNGLELIARVRERQISSRIILITAYSSPELYAAVQRLGVDHYLTKPVPLKLLRRVATAALEAAVAGDTSHH